MARVFGGRTDVPGPRCLPHRHSGRRLSSAPRGAVEMIGSTARPRSALGYQPPSTTFGASSCGCDFSGNRRLDDALARRIARTSSACFAPPRFLLSCTSEAEPCTTQRDSDSQGRPRSRPPPLRATCSCSAERYQDPRPAGHVRVARSTCQFHPFDKLPVVPLFTSVRSSPARRTDRHYQPRIPAYLGYTTCLARTMEPVAARSRSSSSRLLHYYCSPARAARPPLGSLLDATSRPTLLPVLGERELTGAGRQDRDPHRHPTPSRRPGGHPRPRRTFKTRPTCACAAALFSSLPRRLFPNFAATAERWRSDLRLGLGEIEL